MTTPSDSDARWSLEQRLEMAVQSSHAWKDALPADVRQDRQAKASSVHEQTKQWFQSLGTRGYVRDLFLIGPVGTHKTTDAYLGPLHAYKSGRESGDPKFFRLPVRRSMRQFVLDVRQAGYFNAVVHEKAQSALDQMTRAPLLILDEFAMVELTPEAELELHNLIDERGMALLPTVYITNDPEWFKTIRDERTLDRLRRAQRVIYSGESSRPRWEPS